MHSWREMKETKTLNVSRGLHKEVKKGAAEADCLIGDYTDAVLEVGLAHPEEVKQLLEARTKLAQQQEPK